MVNPVIISLTTQAENKNGKLEDITFEVDVSKIQRFRNAEPSEIQKRSYAKSVISYVIPLYVKESGEQILDVIVAASAKAGIDEAKNFGKLTLVATTGQKPFWFRGKDSALGPLPVDKLSRKSGIQSAVRIGNRPQFVRETPQEVRAAIKNANGYVIPDIPVFDTESSGPEMAGRGNAALAHFRPSEEAWDFDVPELRIAPGVVDR